MAVRSKNAHYKLAEIQTRHWRELATKSGVEGAWDAMSALVSRVEAAHETVQARLPKDFPTAVAARIFDGVRRQAGAFVRGMSV